MNTSTEHRRAAVSHAEVARQLGINFSMASRLRSGKRVPSVEMIHKIEGAYHWKAGIQVQAVVDGNFAEKFEDMLRNHYGEEEVRDGAV